MVKDANIWHFKSLVISLLCVRAQLGSPETNQPLLAGGQVAGVQVVFPWNLPFLPHLTTDSAQNE